MNKVIGIRGHRGAGKTTISYLIGNTINYLIKNKEILNDFNDLYRTWCDDIISDEKIIHECGLDYVYFDSFSDTLKLWVKLLIGCPTEYMYDDYYKDHMVINMKDFSYKIHEELPENLPTHSELYEMMPKDKASTTITKNICKISCVTNKILSFLGKTLYCPPIVNSPNGKPQIIRNDNTITIENAAAPIMAAIFLAP